MIKHEDRDFPLLPSEFAKLALSTVGLPQEPNWWEDCFVDSGLSDMTPEEREEVTFSMRKLLNVLQSNLKVRQVRDEFSEVWLKGRLCADCQNEFSELDLALFHSAVDRGDLEEKLEVSEDELGNAEYPELCRDCAEKGYISNSSGVEV